MAERVDLEYEQISDKTAGTQMFLLEVLRCYIPSRWGCYGCVDDDLDGSGR